MLWQDVYRLSPWRGFGREFERLQQEVNRLFSDFHGPARTQEYPHLNIFTSEDDALVTAEVPGIDPKGLDLSIVGNTLTLRGRREKPQAGEGETYHRNERRYGEFVRSIDLPFKVEADRVEAKYERGVLRVRLPRAESDKPRRIAVQGS